MSVNDQRTHIDLFSGIGGFALASNFAGYDTRVFCEQDDYCTGVLNRHWPSVPVIRDIREFDGSKWRGADLLTGGFPCQPFSQAGKQGGTSDDRHLWPEMFRIIKEARPRWILAENVAGIIKMALDDVLSQLEGEGYTTGAIVIPACSLNAPHRRDRVWIMAHARVTPWERCDCCDDYLCNIHGCHAFECRCPGIEWWEEQGISPYDDVADAVIERLEGHTGDGSDWKEPGRDNSPTIRPTSKTGLSEQSNPNQPWPTEPGMGLLADGFPAGLVGGGWWDTEPDIPRVATGVKDRRRKLMALGNAIVPQVAYEIIRLMDNGD